MLRRRRTTPPRGDGPEISVVIPTWNRPRELEDCLAGFAAQTVPAARFEVVVVDDGSDVDLGPVERRFASRLDLRFERRLHAGAAAARNAAIALARAPLLVLGEDDVKPLPTLVEYCLDFHGRHSGEGDALLFHVTPDARLSRSPLMHYLGGSLKPFPAAEGVHGGASFLAGAVSCKRSLFRYGEFDPDLERVEAAELGLRLAARVDLRIHYERIPQATFIRALAAEEALGREYAIAYCWQRVRRRLAHDARASRLLGPLPDPYRHPERFLLGAPAVEQVLQAIHWLESGFAGRNPRFLPAGQHRSLRMLHRLYNTAIAFAQARGWRDAREGRPPGLALPPAARLPPQPPPAPPQEIVTGERGIRAVEAAVAAVARRLGREPTVLDLGSGLELTRLRPYRPVGAPSSGTSALPYLDETFDIVLLPARLARSRAGAAEARRVARSAVIRVPGSGRGAAALHWKRRSAAEGRRAVHGRRGAVRSPARRGRRALVCVPEVPAFDRAGAPGRVMDLVTALAAEGFEVTVAVRAGAREASARAFHERGLNLVSGFGPATDRAIAARGFELVLFADWVTAEAYASTVRRLAPGTRVVVDAPDPGLLLRGRDLVEDASRYGRGLSLEDGAGFARELNVHAAADAVWTASPREAERLSTLLGSACQADVVPDIAERPAAALSVEARRGVLVVADFRRPSDVAAVRRLCERVLPRLDAALRERHPLYIAGDAPPGEVTRWAASVPQARLTGRVPSLEPYVQRCRVVMAPPSFGPGARRMMIHALAAGTPLVGTSASHEELGLQPGRHLLVEQDDARVAAALARVLSDDALWTKLAAAGQAEILARQGEEKARAALRAALDRLRDRPLRRPPRELPVVGSAAQGPTVDSTRPAGDEAEAAAPGLSADMAALLRTGAARHGSRPDVVVLSIIDWNERFQRPQQLALQMAAHGHRVFYVERPRARGEGDAGAGPLLRAAAANVVLVRLRGRAGDFYREGLEPGSARSLADELTGLRSRLGIHDAAVKVDFPAWQPVAQELHRRHAWPLVYDHMEDHGDVQWRRPAGFAAARRRLLRESDLVLAASASLAAEARRERGGPVLVLPNGVTPQDFAQRLPPPKRLRGLRRPVLGYFGLITDWFDAGLVADAARLRPDWTFVLVGQVVDTDVGRLERCGNVVLTGEMPYRELPAAARLFDVCLIPHRRQPRTERAGSVKLFEYLSLGSPIVATPLKWLQGFARQGLVRLARTGEELVAEAEEALAHDTGAARRRRRQAAERHSWRSRYEALRPALAGAFPLVSIVIVSTDAALTRRCVKGVLAATAWPRIEVMVAANGAGGSLRDLQDLGRAQQRVRVLSTRRRMSFARAANRAIAAARGEYLVLLDDAAFVTHGWLGGLVGHLSDPRVGAVAPVTNLGPAKVALDYQTSQGVEAFAARFAAIRPSEASRTGRLSMSCLALPRHALDGTGRLDERFEGREFVEADYGRRLRAAGYRLLRATGVFVHHAGGAGVGASDPAFERDRARFERKWRRRRAGGGRRKRRDR